MPRPHPLAVTMLAALAVGAPAGTALAQEPPAPTPPAPTPTVAPAAPTTTVAGQATAPTTTSTTMPDGRTWLVAVPSGCEAPRLPDVVFVGTLLETGTPAGAPETSETETGRFRVDQARSGAIERYAYDGVVDVRFGIDTKYLARGEQYLIGASFDPDAAALVSKVRQPEPLFGGDDVIGVTESDVTCPVIEDPVRTMRIDGSPIDAGVVTPLVEDRRGLLRALLLPATVAFGIIFALAAVRWLVTGVGRGVGSVVRTASVPREVRGAMRSRPRVTDEQ